MLKTKNRPAIHRNLNTLAMETTKPELTWIGGSCYRVNDVRDDAGEQKQQPSNEYVEEG